MRKEGKKILLLDTGNLLFRRPLQTETKQKDALLRVELLIQSYNEMGYDAVNVGEKDLMMGLRFLSEAAQKAKFSFLSSNLIDRKTQRTIFSPYRTKEVAGLKIAILGLMDDPFSPALQQTDSGLTLLDPIRTSRDLIKELKKSSDLIIVLSQLGESKDKRLARENPQIDLILGGRRRSSESGD